MSTVYGVIETGFVLRRLSDILDGMVTALSTVIDPITGETLTPNLADENDPMIQQINAFSDVLAEAWEHLQLTYNQFDPSKATGAGLSGLVQLNGIRRQAGTYSTVTLTLTGTAGKYLPAGQQVGDINDIIVFELPEVTFDGSGDATVVATCTEKGPVAAAIGTLIKILTPVAWWRTVTNLTAATLGVAEETDLELRARQKLSTMTTASSLVESVYGAICNIADVLYCRVYQNLTLITDARDIPAKCIAVVVLGGTDAAIAQVLWTKASAFPMHGSTTVVVTDRQGLEYDMKFIRPTSVPIYIIVNVTVIDVLLWPVNGDDLIIAAILSFANNDTGALGLISGVVPVGWTIGQSVYDSELYIPVNTVPGLRITSIKLGVAPDPTTTSVTIDWDEMATFSSENITVNVT
jgi:uncharacterized phage protein gp47/JayE